MSKDGRINVSVQTSTKARLLKYTKEHDISQGDVIDAALKDYFARIDREYSAPDMVLDRLNQMFMSQMNVAQTVGQIKDVLDRHLGEDE